jgi:hypothetical protein
MADLATIARPYAEALAGTASPEEMAKWSEQLGSLAHLASNHEVAILSSNPNVSQEQLADLLMAGISGDTAPALKKFITLLTLNHRIAALPEISKQLDEIKNAKNLNMWLDVNGKPMQRGNTKKMIFDVATIVSYASEFMTLMPGDIIATGTPSGVGFGRTPQEFLKPGDMMETQITGVGIIRNKIA